MAKRVKGEIRTKKEIFCGICFLGVELENTKKLLVEQEVKDKGWEKTEKYGWICMYCEGPVKGE